MPADPTLPGRSLEAQFDALWQRFNGLSRTVDTLATRSARWRRLLTPVNVSLIVPIQDEAVCTYLTDAQRKLGPYMAYVPQPVEKLHVTLALLGFLQAGLPLPGTWTQNDLRELALNLQTFFAKLPSFTVKIGPINAFPNVAIAEVHDNGQLRLLEKAALEMVPKSRRSTAPYPLIPHITLGYFGSRPTRPVIQVLTPLRATTPLNFTIDQAALTLYYRGFGPYRAKYALRHSVEEVLSIMPFKPSPTNSMPVQGSS
jgi:2'-5' RNA ligase